MMCERCRSRRGEVRYVQRERYAMCRKCWDHRLSNGWLSRELRLCWIVETFGPLERYTPLTEAGMELNGKG